MHLRTAEYVIETPIPDAAATALIDCNGRHTIAELAHRAGCGVDLLIQHLAPLAADGSIVDLARADQEDPESFLAAYLDLCDLWVNDIYSRPFWEKVLEGKASRGLILGWGVEFRHFVSAANEYMAAGVAHARSDTVIQQWLAEHYVEEHDHAEIFLEGLVRDGLDRVQVSLARPLPTTRALTSFLHEVALSDTYAYAGTFALMQSPRHDRTLSNIRALYADLTDSYSFASGLLGALRRHAELDVELGHEELVLEKILRKQGGVRADQRAAILAAGWSLAEHFMLFFDGIYDHYRDLPGIILRTQPDIRLYVSR